MSRVKRGIVTRKRHKRLIKKASGFWGQRKNVFRRAKETLLRAMAFAFVGRKHLKRSARRLFITRINAACRQHGIPYGKFIFAAKQKGVALDRKILSQLAVLDSKAFEFVLQQVTK